MFKLFGFLDNSKELNTKGVGLGLHISQQITEEFGGKILLDSDQGEGAIFTFLIDLDEKVGGQTEIKRILNPSKKIYPQIKIQKVEKALQPDEFLAISERTVSFEGKIEENLDTVREEFDDDI